MPADQRAPGAPKLKRARRKAALESLTSWQLSNLEFKTISNLPSALRGKLGRENGIITMRFKRLGVAATKTKTRLDKSQGSVVQTMGRRFSTWAKSWSLVATEALRSMARAAAKQSA